MQTGSVFINKITALFRVLNKYFEYSLIYKMLAYVGKVSKTSAVVGVVREGLCRPVKRDYIGGSLLLSFFTGAFAFVFRGLSGCYKYLARLNEKSVNKAIFDRFIAALAEPSNTVCAGAGVLSGMFIFFAGYLMLKGFYIYGIICFAAFSACFYVCFFISENMLNGIKNSVPFRLVAAFFSREDSL